MKPDPMAKDELDNPYHVDQVKKELLLMKIIYNAIRAVGVESPNGKSTLLVVDDMKDAAKSAASEIIQRFEI